MDENIIKKRFRMQATCFFFACFFTWFGSSCEKTPLIQTQNQTIIGGKDDIRYPAIGALTNNKVSFCTGTLIAEKVVITAAHCIDSALRHVKSRRTVQFRVESPTNSSPGYFFQYYDFDPKLFSRHPKWNLKIRHGYDVGFGILKKKLAIQTIPVNLKPLASSWVGKQVLFLGYGITQSSPTRVSAKRKQSVELTLRTILDDRFTVQDKSKSVCHGDSGGPALLTIDGKLRVVGVNSYVSAARVPGTTRSSCAGSGTAMRTDTFESYVTTILDTYGKDGLVCDDDNDCSFCHRCSQEQVCKPVSTISNPSNCKPCSRDSDCGKGVCFGFPDGYRCVASCSQTNCCPTGSFCDGFSTNSQSIKLCMPLAKRCPQATCQKDSDCGKGEHCLQQVCLPKPVKQAGQTCQTCQKNEDCGSQLCTNVNGTKRCVQACSAGLFCPPDFDCKVLIKGYPKQCVPRQGACQQSCVIDADCPTNETCISGSCSKHATAKEGESCALLPCEKDLTCKTTPLGKVCLKPCGATSGQPGSLCDQHPCNQGLTCSLTTRDESFCHFTCKSPNDCKPHGGGVCSQGVCACRRDSECATDYVCHKPNKYLGACVKKSDYRTCDTGKECQAIENEVFCVGTTSGNLGYGEKCSPFHRCKDGFTCIATDDGSFCLESCKQDKSCELGGSCVKLDGNDVCSCKITASQKECPNGRACKVSPLSSNFGKTVGLCVGNGLTNPCISTKECPSGWSCEKGRCIDPLAPPQKEEPIQEEPIQEEPIREKIKGKEEISHSEDTIDGSTAEISKDSSEPQHENKKEQKDSHPQKEMVQESIHDDNPGTSDGCNCSTNSKLPQEYLFLLSLFCFLLVRRKTTQ